jgi:carbohydrate kinase (thermoresistant glucokinase family)
MLVVLCGVCGSGKTTVGDLLSKRLHWRFFDGDDFHPPESKRKMSAGFPLTDEDRWPWLNTLAEVTRPARLGQDNAILACSALKQIYRQKLVGEAGLVRFFLLHGDSSLLSARMGERKGHFMNPALLNDQIETLQREDHLIELNVQLSPEEIVERIISILKMED